MIIQGITQNAKTALLILVLVLLCHVQVYAQDTTLNSITYTLVYSPLDNAGIMTIRFYIDAGEEIYNVTIPAMIFEHGIIEFLNYTVTPELCVLGSSFDQKSGFLIALLSGRGLFEALFHVENLFEELPMGYIVTLDTTILQNTVQKVLVELFVAGAHDVHVSRFYGRADVSQTVENNVTKVTVSGFTWLELAFEVKLETSPTGQPVSQNNWLPLVVAISATSITVAVAVYLLRSRRTVLSVEYADPYRDPALRLIIKTLGKAGEQGLTQSELARKTGLPKSSISRKVRRLQNEGIVEVKTVGKYNYVLLTSKGLNIYRRIMSEETGRK